MKRLPDLPKNHNEHHKIVEEMRQNALHNVPAQDPSKLAMMQNMMHQSPYWKARARQRKSKELRNLQKNYAASHHQPPLMPIAQKALVDTLKNTTEELKQTIDRSQYAGQEISVSRHYFDDHTPVIKSADDFQELYTPKTLQYIWSANNLDYPVAMQLKADIQAFFDLSLAQQATYMQEIMDVRTITQQDLTDDACDPELLGHRGVFALKDIPAMSVIGIYGGIFIKDEQAMFDLAHKLPLEHSQDYLFRIPIADKYPKITAYQHGNRLSIVNSASNYKSQDDDVVFDQIRRRANIMLLTAKTSECPIAEISNNPECPDTLLFIAGRDIPKGTQLLYDYGNCYW